MKPVVAILGAAVFMGVVAWVDHNNTTGGDGHTAWSATAARDGDAESMKRAKRAVIAQCWQDQGKKSATPAEARTVAGWCERMAADYRTAYRSEP